MEVFTQLSARQTALTITRATTAGKRIATQKVGRGTASLFVTVFFALSALLGCATLQVTVDYDPETDFSTFHTYSWLTTPDTHTPSPASGDPTMNSPLVDQRIRNAVDAALQQRGFRLLTGGEPDFFIAAYVTVKSKARVQSSGYHYGYYGPGYWGAGPYTYVDNYEEGSLILDFVSTKSKQLAWRGVARDRLRHNPSAEELDQGVIDAVQGILARFPPGAQ